MVKVAFLTTDKREHDRFYRSDLPTFGTAPEALLQGLSKCPEVEVHVISCLQSRVKSPAKLADNIWYHARHVPNLGWLKTGYQGCIRAVRSKLHEIQPDIVHGQGSERDCAISAAFSGYPNVMTIHGNMQAIAEVHQARPLSFYWNAARLERLCLKRTHGVFCNSEYTEALVSPFAKKTWRVPNALRQNFFGTQPKRTNVDHPVILNVGVISPRKRQLEILRMAGRLFDRGVQFQLGFIGSIGEDAYGKAFRNELETSREFAEYRGTLGLAELAEAFDAADALVHFPMEEAFGLVVAEGMARGLKFFGSRTGGIIDITHGVEDAELTGTEDWTDLEDRISRWIQNGFPRSIDGPTVMRSRYTPVAVAQRHIEIYEEVLRGKNRARS